MSTNIKPPYSRWRTPQGRIYEVMYSNEKFTRMMFEDTGKCRTEYTFKLRFDEEVSGHEPTIEKNATDRGADRTSTSEWH